MIYKVIARVTENSRYVRHLNIGNQWKKKLYVSKSKFDKHGIKLILRWHELGHFVEVLTSEDGEIFEHYDILRDPE